MFKVALALRRAIAKLPVEDISHFLVQVMLVKGSARLTTSLFFLFEVFACWVDNANMQQDTGQCSITSIASTFLSIYVMIGTAQSCAKELFPRDVRNSVTLTKERLAAFELTNN